MRTAIGKERPVPEEILRCRKEEAEKIAKSSGQLRDEIRSVYKENQAADHTLAPMLQERQKLVEEHAKLDNLYRLVSAMSAVPEWIWKHMCSVII